MEDKLCKKILEQQETIKGMQNNEESLIKIMKEYEDYKIRVDKTIEYMEKNSKISLDDSLSITLFYSRLLEILKGSDKE